VRGPGSAVWGANAMTGVVNVITKRPRDMLGTSVVVGTPYANVVHAQASNGFAYKVSAGYFEEDAYDRPTGVVPGSSPPQTYPDFRNTGTVQKRANAVLDWDTDTGNFSLALGSAATDGIIHTGIGPFDIERGALFSYVDADWNFGNAHASLALTKLDGDAQNLLTLSANGQPLGFEFVTDTYDLEVSSANDVGTRHSLSYGGNVRTNDHTLEIAPGAAEKDEWGVYLQDEIALGERWRWVVGARYDDIDPLADAVFTPRTSLLYSFAPGQTLRVSYNRAFRTPSAVNSYLDVSILQQAGALLVPADAVGNPLLGEERLTAYEVGYAGVLGDDIRFTVDAYRNEIEDSIDFFVAGLYGPGNLPAASPGVPGAVIPCFNFAPGTGPGACPFGGLAGLVPSAYSYRNVGRTVNRGIEVALDRDFGEWGWFANLSWQDEPDVAGVPIEEVNLPPEWRLNLGVDRDAGDYFWNVTLNYQDESYWSDVLFARATTDAFTQVNAAIGWRFRNERLTLKLIGQNLFDEDVQQHIFGDLIGRRVQGQIGFEF
jgi:iron complex outermembrane receptor protein